MRHIRVALTRRRAELDPVQIRLSRETSPQFVKIAAPPRLLRRDGRAQECACGPQVCPSRREGQRTSTKVISLRGRSSAHRAENATLWGDALNFGHRGTASCRRRTSFLCPPKTGSRCRHDDLHQRLTGCPCKGSNDCGVAPGVLFGQIDASTRTEGIPDRQIV